MESFFSFLPPMLQSIIALVAGFTIIFFSADVFTDNSAKVASIYKISPLIIGILILGFGTSAPEMLVSGLAAFEEHPELAVGNAFGSNIFNIALVLGVTAMISPIKIDRKLIKIEWRFLIAYTLITGLLLLDKGLSLNDGYFLLLLLVVFLGYTFYISKKAQHKFDNLSLDVDSSQKWKIWGALFLSLVVLLVSAKLTVFGATSLAAQIGLSDLIIGLTIVALGTSLPELAVSITSAYKNQHEMVVGNIIGSNIFNTVGVLAIPGMISPIEVLPENLIIDYIFMFSLTLLIGVFISNNFLSRPSAKQIKDKIDEREGLFLVIILIIYIIFRIYL